MFEASAGAVDLTGTWNGKYSCQDFDGDYDKFKSNESVLRIVQTGTTLVASIDGGAASYDGAVIDSTAKPAQEGEAVMNLCLTGGAGGELFKIKAKVDPEKGTGTITGVSEVLKEKMKGVRICAVEPGASPVISGGEPGFHKIQGLGAGFIPAVLNRQILDEVITVSDEEATTCTRRLAAEEGLLVGISSGAACCAALKIARTLGKGHVVVTIFADKGEHYLSTDLFGEKKWMPNSNA